MKIVKNLFSKINDTDFLTINSMSYILSIVGVGRKERSRVAESSVCKSITLGRAEHK